MIHSGQEFARSKALLHEGEWHVVRDSYNRDDEINWIDFRDLKLNESLFHFYRGVIALRKSAPALRRASPDRIHFQPWGERIQISCRVEGEGTGDLYDWFWALNADPEEPMHRPLPAGVWEVVVRDRIASLASFELITGGINLPPRTCFLARQLRKMA